jgi:hypothetical protein
MCNEEEYNRPKQAHWRYGHDKPEQDPNPEQHIDLVQHKKRHLHYFQKFIHPASRCLAFFRCTRVKNEVITKVTTADAFNRYGFYSLLAFAIFFSLASVSSHQSSLALATLIPCLTVISQYGASWLCADFDLILANEPT